MGLVESFMLPGVHHTCKSDLPLVQLSVQGQKAVPCLIVKSKMTPRATVLYFHGNADDLCDVYRLAKRLCSDYPITVVCPEYKGYGLRQKQGQGDEQDCYNIADSAMQYIIKHANNPLIVAGCSIGSGPASYVAQKYEQSIFGAVLISAYSSIRNLGKDYAEKLSGLVDYVIPDIFNNEQRLSQYRGRLILIHGLDDQGISCNHSRRIFDRSISRHKHLVLLEGEQHNLSNFATLVMEPVWMRWSKYFVSN